MTCEALALRSLAKETIHESNKELLCDRGRHEPLPLAVVAMMISAQGAGHRIGIPSWSRDHYKNRPNLLI